MIKSFSEVEARDGTSDVHLNCPSMTRKYNGKSLNFRTTDRITRIFSVAQRDYQLYVNYDQKYQS